MRCRTTVCFSLLMFFAGQSEGATTGGTVSEIEMALANANTDYLRMQGDRDAARALPARAAYFRTKGEISNSDKWASRCIEDAIVLAQPGSNALYQCLGILAGNRLWLGDIRGWAETMIKVRRLGASQPSLRVSALYQEANIDGMQFEAFLDRPASSVTNVPNGIVEVPVKHLRDWPVISAKITGGGDGAKRDVNVEFLVDTGAARSFLSPGFARSIGLETTPGFVHEQRGGRIARTSLVDPVTLIIGGIELRDFSFAESDGVKPNIIGLDVLRQLGPLLLNDEVLRLLGPAWKHTGCTTPLRIASDPWARYWELRSPMKIDGVDRLPQIDTGLTGLLEVRGLRGEQGVGGSWQEAPVATMFGRVDRRVRMVQMPVVGNGMDGKIAVSVVEPVSPLPPETWLLGGGVLATRDLLVNLDSNLLCLRSRR